jgi:hypothetical protein
MIDLKLFIERSDSMFILAETEWRNVVLEDGTVLDDFFISPNGIIIEESSGRILTALPITKILGKEFNNKNKCLIYRIKKNLKI